MSSDEGDDPRGRKCCDQLVVIGFSGHPMNTRTREYRRFVRLASQEHVGGLILVNVANGRTVARADPLEAASFINRMQRLARIPLLISADFERGASMREWMRQRSFPHAMAFIAASRAIRKRRRSRVARNPRLV